MQIERDLINIVQRDFPLEQRPFAAIGKKLGISEMECLDLLRSLAERGILREIRPVISWNKVGFRSLLIGLEVTPQHVDEVASAINNIPGVTHNYLRNGRINLWCTLTYSDIKEKQKYLSFMRSLEGVVDIKEFDSEKTYKIGLVLDV